MYLVDGRSGSMHGKKFLIKEVQYGTDGSNFFLRVDFHTGYEAELSGMEARLTLESLDGKRSSASLLISSAGGHVSEQQWAGSSGGAPAIECAFSRVLEARVGLGALGLERGAGLRFQFSLWQSGLPMDAVPQQGWVMLRTTDPTEMTG